MSVSTVTEQYHVPYNGRVVLRSHYSALRGGKRRVTNRTIQWLDVDVAQCGRTHIVTLRVSKVDLLRAIYRAGYSVVSAPKRRILDWASISTDYIPQPEVRVVEKSVTGS